MASWLMRMVSSSGKSSRSRRAICSGLHALAHRRGCRRPCRRPFQGTTGPRTAALPGPPTSPASLSCTYRRSAAFTASFVGFGRRAARSACHCAVVARYASPPLRVAALRRSSREIVDAARPSRRAVSRTPQPRARNSAMSSRSANDRYRSDGGFDDGASVLGGMPPASRNQRAPTAGDTPTSIAAVAAQNRRRFSRCATPGRPGDRGTTARSARSERRFPALIATPSVKVLRRLVEPKGFARIAYPWHPLYGRCLRVGQRTTRGAADLLLVEERIGVLRELPAWMCDEAACAAMTPGPPAVAIAALNDLTLVLAGLTAKHPSPSSSSSPVTLESPYEGSVNTRARQYRLSRDEPLQGHAA